ncbi:hypothetical protein [Rufibacter sp. LB8]|uniref:hypothetical protein n=1 Tax=Rufibacter sp. LB8 TaxID=2777781 RepID=UPI00178C28BE|nr:hypothetical protein [Rufibacter sp. LB8]
MKRYLPLLGVFLLFFLVVSGFARGEAVKTTTVSKNYQTVFPGQAALTPSR